MKKILLSLMLITAIGAFSKMYAQCGLSNFLVKVNSSGVDPLNPANCKLNISISFDMTSNSGNKYIYMHLWKSSDYAFINYNYTGGGAKGPKLDDLNGNDAQNAGTLNDDNHPPIASIGINNDVSPVAYLATYSADAGVTLVSGNPIITTPITGGAHYEINNISISFPGLCTGTVIQGDIWSTQAQSSNPAVHCAIEELAFVGDPTINGTVNCSNPRTFQVLINTVSVATTTATYKVFIDNGIVGTYEPGTDVLVYTSGTINFSASSPYNSGNIAYVGNYNRPLIVELNSTSPVSRLDYGTLDNGCIPLPVKFKYFNASRTTTSNVSITWTTASEQNSKGFNVQKNVGGEWKTIAFVPSQAQGGNSSYDLNYSFKDANNEKGITQYRVQQVDLDGKFAYTDIRAIRGEGTVGKIVVYPNPSVDGKVNVVFEDNTVRDIQVNDMQGKVIRSYKGITNNILVIERLTSGFYTIKITNRNTAASSVEKVVVK
jgi:hypothetical protein